MTDPRNRLLTAVRCMDTTDTGEQAALKIINGIDVPGEQLMAAAGWLARRVAGHLNTPGHPEWDDRDDAEADHILDVCMASIHVGGRTKKPNLNKDADKAMTALVQLAREKDDAERLGEAHLYAKTLPPTAVAYVGAQLVWYFAHLTGDLQAFCDAIQLELVELRMAATASTTEGE